MDNGKILMAALVIMEVPAGIDRKDLQALRATGKDATLAFAAQVIKDTVKAKHLHGLEMSVHGGLPLKLMELRAGRELATAFLEQTPDVQVATVPRNIGELLAAIASNIVPDCDDPECEIHGKRETRDPPSTM